jgi:hypothetical protein
MIVRCPFAVLGLDSDQMAACPGFDGEVVTFGLSAPTMARQGLTCLHLGADRGMRGFVGGCHHPEADVVLPVATELVRADISRNRPQVVIDPIGEAPPAQKRGAGGTPAA